MDAAGRNGITLPVDTTGVAETSKADAPASYKNGRNRVGGR